MKTPKIPGVTKFLINPPCVCFCSNDEGMYDEQDLDEDKYGEKGVVVDEDGLRNLVDSDDEEDEEEEQKKKKLEEGEEDSDDEDRGKKKDGDGRH